MEDHAWSTQHRLLLSNILEAMPSQNWPAIGRVMRQFSLSTTLSGDAAVYVPKVRFPVLLFLSLSAFIGSL